MKNFKVGIKLTVGFLIVSILTMIVGYVGIKNMGQINNEADNMYNKELLGLSYIKDSNINLVYQGRAIRNYLLAQSTPGIEPLPYLNAVMKFRESFAEKLKLAKPLFSTEEGKNRLAELDKAFTVYIETQDKIIRLAQEEEKTGLNQQNRQSVAYVMSDARAAADKVDEIMDSLATIKEQNAFSASEVTTDLYVSSKSIMISIIIISVIIGTIIGYLITRGITVPLQQAVLLAEQIADGNLTSQLQVTGKDETAQVLMSMKSMLERFAQVVKDIRGSAESLASASEEVSATAQSISQATSEQAASVEETSASIEQMTASINQSAENSKTTEEIALNAAKDANEGGQAVGQTVSAMKSIADKISIIDDIAYQTNLLALNAAIEAARAGEHGKGFAVVATEVRKLAERSQVAAQEIGEVAKNSVSLAEKAGSLLDEMVPNINKTSELIQEISAASEEQSSGASQVNTAMSQLNQITQQNASASEELAATSEEMSGQAEQLQQMVGFFRVSEDQANLDKKVAKPTNKSAQKPKIMDKIKSAIPTIDEGQYVKF